MQQPNNFSPVNPNLQANMQPQPVIQQVMPPPLTVQTNKLSSITTTAPHKASMLLTVGVWVLTAIVFFLAGYITRILYSNYVNNNQADSENTALDVPLTEIPEAFDYSGWNVYSNKVLGISIKYPAGWTVGDVREENLSGCTAVYFDITNSSGYTFQVFSPCNALSQVCSYKNESAINLPDTTTKIEFDGFTEIVDSNNTYRRSTVINKEMVICKMDTEYYSTFVKPFGFITYTVPENPTTEMLVTMDRMLLSLSDVIEPNTPTNVISNGTPVATNPTNATTTVTPTVRPTTGQ